MTVTKSIKVKNKNHVRMGKRDVIYNIAAICVFTLIALICFYPFYYLMICTISNQKMVDLNQILFLPHGINFKNYVEIFQVQNLANSAFISVARTICTTALSLVCTSYMAYFFTKTNMWGRKFWYRFTVITMYFSAGMIPEYLNNRMLGLTNSFGIYVIPAAISVYNMVLVKTNIESMSPELEESAYLDGAGYLTTFFKIILPLQTPILATVSLFTAVNQWNDFFTTKLYITNTKLYTLQYLLYELLQQVTAAAEQINNANPYASITPTGIRLTLTAIVIIPIICVYPFVQRFYVKGIMVGAVKG
ncbi:carbohydrate ABC transporter membrane protein 2 (CUT1 family) [Hungatella effluvii]|uniref:Carbohydrate ABC transporter membrane protein 2 (CUT1 family) n=1 Tax=Hungatella effluvii TaxID=1096246 RepID=A0A2V3Y631_9FIRM|nr:carbohydrate ABC transporter permease [Hungatella effluvii]PXX51999.1 carbohydrate ABC transporter membrane protein 2 (CUT1 family) [Hungatella effluvii]